MSSSERDVSREREPSLRHGFTWSEAGRASVPMWDSSDPDRAPPPLPLNPSTHSPTTRANTSAGIAAAAKLIVEKARENTPISSYTRNSEGIASGSPERSLIKGAHHRRMQSFQPGNVKDIRNYLDNRSPERSPERPASVDVGAFARKESIEEMSPFEQSSTPTPSSRDPLKDTPTLRPSARPGPRPLLGEGTPPSATMLALQTMQVPDQPLTDITNGPSTPTPSRQSGNLDFSTQLVNLTSIANNLQREMAQLSRRSKDNATDLISLKEATSQRDEDIRKSLRDLSSNFKNVKGLLEPPPLAGSATRNTSGLTGLFDGRLLSSPPSASKSYGLPRAASAPSFLEDGHIGSPSPFSVEGVASVAMLEKIIREMVTKEGQERLQTSLSELLEKSRKENSDAAKKVEQLSEFIKEKSESQALVPLSKDGPPAFNLGFESPGLNSRTRDASGKEGKMIGLDDELMKMLQRIKDSISHSGGTTSEVKGLVRDLRGEVLGMGRDLGRKLDQVGQTGATADRSIDNSQHAENAEEIQRIVEEGINELKEQLSSIMRERAEGDDDAFKQLATRSAPDEEGIFAVVKHALAEHGAGLAKRDLETEGSDLDREGILDAVKEGLKDFEPNIELQQFGLERDEILSVLKEGLEDYQNNRAEPAPASIDKGEIYEVMQEALKDFQAPLPHEHIAQVKEELLDNLRQALEEYRPIASEHPIDHEATRAAVTEAVRDGLANHGPAAPREIEISREDLFDAVKASLDGSTIPFGGFGEQVLQQLHELISEMRVEFKQYSAANGRDTEQVLDAVKDGLESLRAEIEQYVDRAQDVTGKDEIVDTVKGGLEQLRSDVQSYISQNPAHDTEKGEMLEYIRSEFEHLHQTINDRDGARDIGEQAPLHSAEIIMAMKEGLDELKGHVSGSRGLDEEGPSEEMLDAMKEEFDQLKQALLNANAHDKSELVETIQDSMGALHAKMNGSEMSMLSGGAAEDVVREMRLEFSQLKESLHAIVIDGEREAIITGVRQAIDDLRMQLSADQSDGSAEALGAIKEELEQFKQQVNGSIAPSSDGTRSIDDDTLSTLKSHLDEIKETAGPGMNDEMLEAIRGEFENLRNSFASSMVHGGQHEEVLDTVRLGLDDLRSHVDRKLDNPDHSNAHHNELLDAINEGLETLRADIVKTLDKPLDMTVNYEILETLKDGMAALRTDMDKLRSVGAMVDAEGNQVVLAADNNAVGEAREISRDMPAPEASNDSLSRADLERMEVLITQLQIKIEAMDATVQDLPQSQPAQPAEGAAMRDDIVCLETMLKELQDSVANIATQQEGPSRTGLATKGDTDAIETLLRNTKAHIEELALPEGANMVTKDHLDSVEAVVRVTNDGIDAITDKLDNAVATKADVAVVEVLASDMKTTLDEVALKLDSREAPEGAETMTKADLDVLGIICTEIKTKVNEMEFPDALPSKSDFEQLESLIHEFRESHDKMKESYENDIAITAKAFDDRKQDFEETVREISEVKTAVAEIKEEVITKISESDCGIDALGETLRGIEERSNNDAISSDVRELIEKVTEEFKVAHESLESLKDDHQQAADSSLEKQVEHRSALESLINEKLETYFDGLMSKYDDAQNAAQEQARAMEEKASAQEELMTSTKAMADDLKLSIDTLGTTLTSFCATFPDTVERMAEESKTVFNKVDDTYNKLDETQEGLRAEHGATRDEIGKLVSVVNFLQSDLSEHNPRFMVALQEVQALIGQHHDDSRKAFDAAADHAQAVKDLQEQVRGLGTQNDDLRNNVIPGLSLPAPTSTSERSAPMDYDDSALHEKLDRLMGHAREGPDASSQLEKLDQIHERVMATAAEVSAFVSQQTKQITDDHGHKEREVEELALLLERRQMKKEELEDDIIVLNDEKESLAQAVEALKAEKEALAAQKSRLNAEVSSLETAMQIRRTELHEMDHKAETLERRIMDGVMNQSRMLLLAKSVKSSVASSTISKKCSAKPPRQSVGRDLRIPSNASAASAQTVTSSVPSLKPNHALALRSRGPPATGRGGAANSAERRIMSLNQINHNVPTGSAAFTSMTPSLISSGPGGMKRSHSVKTTQVLRKPSWTVPSGSHLGGEGNDKENEILEEGESPYSDDDEHDGRVSSSSYRDGSQASQLNDDIDDGEDLVSDAGTERRRTSHLTYSTITDDVGGRESLLTPENEHGGRASYASGVSGSYLTNSELSRASFGSSAGGVVGSMPSAIDEEDEDEGDVYEEAEDGQQGAEKGLAAYEAADAHLDDDVAQRQYGSMDGKMRLYAPPSDSGLGTDLPTVALGGPGSLMGRSDYFKIDEEQ